MSRRCAKLSRATTSRTLVRAPDGGGARNLLAAPTRFALFQECADAFLGILALPNYSRHRRQVVVPGVIRIAERAAHALFHCTKAERRIGRNPLGPRVRRRF